MAQFILAQMLKPKVAAATKAFKEAQAAADPVQIQEATAALEHVWKSNMVVLGIIVGVAMFIAVLVAKNGPETYGMKPFGAMPTPAGAAAAPNMSGVSVKPSPNTPSGPLSSPSSPP